MRTISFIADPFTESSLVRTALALMLVAGAGTASSQPVCAQSVVVRSDPNVELLAITFRLAGRSEYNLTRVPTWAAAVDRHFEPHRNHLAVDMARRWGFGFFIPMNLAVHLTPAPDLAERVPFAASSSLHRRWTAFPDSTRVFVERIRDFSQKAEFQAFWATQQPLLDSAAARLGGVARAVDRHWLDRFWGRAASMNYVLVPALTNGSASYGQEYVSPADVAEGYALIGVTRVDHAGFPLFDSTDEPTILHELNHPYVSALVRQYAAELGPSAEALFAGGADAMRAQAYGSWDAMINESLVRAAVVHYYRVHGASIQAERILAQEMDSGFLWMNDLVTLLEQYELDRQQYRSMVEFMPRIVSFFERWAADR